MRLSTEISDALQANWHLTLHPKSRTEKFEASGVQRERVSTDCPGSNLSSGGQARKPAVLAADKQVFVPTVGRDGTNEWQQAGRLCPEAKRSAATRYA